MHVSVGIQLQGTLPFGDGKFDTLTFKSLEIHSSVLFVYAFNGDTAFVHPRRKSEKLNLCDNF